MKKITLTLCAAGIAASVLVTGCGSGGSGTRTVQAETTPPKNSFQSGVQNSNIPPQAKNALLGKH